MSDAQENVIQAVTEAAAAAASTAEAQAKTAQETAEIAIEHAEARIEAAEETAQAIADAALQTEMGRKISEVERDFKTWQSETQTRLETLTSQLSQANNQIAELLARPVAVITPQAAETGLQSSIPPKSETVTAEILEPNSLGDAEADRRAAEESRTLQKRVRRLI
jgi:hypothetical protein